MAPRNAFAEPRAPGRRPIAATHGLAAVAAILVLLGCLGATSRAAQREEAVRLSKAAVVSVNLQASRAGAEMMRRGGNAVDAAVAVAFTLAVTYPAAGNLGGGGYLLYVPADPKAESVVIDFREVAPAAATREMFVAPAGRTPHRRVGVPGTVRGLALAHARFGRLPWAALLRPAIRLARDGFSLDEAVADELNKVLAASDKTQFAALHAAFAHPDRRPWQAGDHLVQRDLAETLVRIAEQGADGFYTGKTAELIAAEMRRGSGLLTTADLAAYQPVARAPLVGTYRDCQILAVPPSSSGGVTLIEMLNILETFDLRSQGRWSSETLHLMVEAMRRAYRDRACYLGDPASTEIPAKLTDKQYARELAAAIDLNRATPSESLADGIELAPESDQTTHFSVVDQDRNAVSLTYTLESGFGSRVVVNGGGFLLNDEMNDFNWLPGVTDRTGRIGTLPNQVAPGKRMLSSMCPIVVRRGGKTLLVTGSPGGRTIINTVLEMVVNVVDFEMDVRDAVDSPRLHHQWFPDRVRYEPLLAEESPAALMQLRKLGHRLADRPVKQGDAHTIWIDPASGELSAAADRRISGSASGY
jgi:gamma-glutamyltranspeptidase/glutathione hydrolase